jgi:hypothetical protein
MDQRRIDTIAIITVDLHNLTIAIRIMVIAISRSVIMGHLTSIDHLLTEIVDKKSNEIKKIIIIS